MTDLSTAAQQALEALEGGGDSWRLIGPAIEALRAALEQPERAQRMRDAGFTRRPTIREMSEPEQPERCACGDRPKEDCPGEWEPGCDLGNNQKYARRVEWTPSHITDRQFYTHPPRREWRGLTEDELAELARQEELLLICDDFDALREIARAIEAALKERNA